MLNQENSNSYSRMLAIGLVALPSTASAGMTRIINFLHQDVSYQLRVSEAHGLGNIIETAIRSGSCGVEFINSTMNDAYIMRDDIIEGFQSLNIFQITERVSRHHIESFDVIQFLRDQTQQAQEGLIDCMNSFLRMATDTTQSLANDETWNVLRSVLITAVIFKVVFGIVSCLYIKNIRNDLAERQRHDRPEEGIFPKIIDQQFQENNKKNLESFLRMTEQEQELFDNVELYEPYLDNAENFHCPIGKAIMQYPVTTSSGHSYEYNNITAHFSANSNNPNPYDPRSATPLQSKELRPNWDLKNIIIENLQAAKKKWESEQKGNTTLDPQHILLQRKNR